MSTIPIYWPFVAKTNPLYTLETEIGSILGNNLVFDATDHIAQIISPQGNQVVARGVKTGVAGVLIVHFIENFNRKIDPQLPALQVSDMVWSVVNLTDTTAQPNPIGFFDYILQTNSFATFFSSVVFPAIPNLEIMF